MNSRQDGKGEYEFARKRRAARSSDSESPEPEAEQDDTDFEEGSRVGDQYDDFEEDAFTPVVKKRRLGDGSDMVKDGKKRRMARLPDVEVVSSGMGNAKARPSRKDKGKQRKQERHSSQNWFDDNDLVGFDFGNESVFHPFSLIQVSFVLMSDAYLLAISTPSMDQAPLIRNGPHRSIFHPLLPWSLSNK